MNEDVKANIVLHYGLLTLLLIYFKVSHTVDWSWWWILAPLWTPVVAYVLITGVVFAFYKVVHSG